MKIQDIIDLAERLKQYDKLRELQDFASTGTYPNTVTITVKKGTTTRSVSISGRADVEDFLTQIDNTILKIERTLKELNIGE